MNDQDSLVLSPQDAALILRVVNGVELDYKLWGELRPRLRDLVDRDKAKTEPRDLAERIETEVMVVPYLGDDSQRERRISIIEKLLEENEASHATKS